MDLYTVSLDLPSDSSYLSRTETLEPHDASIPLPPSSSRLPSAPTGNNGTSASSPNTLTIFQAEEQWREVQAKCLDITSREGCLVSATREGMGMEEGSVPQTVESDGDDSRPLPESPTYNYHLSGSYQGVMAARGDLLREAPRDNCLSIRIPRTDLLESPLAQVSNLKPDVLRRLEVLAVDTQARLTVFNVAATGSCGSTSAVIAIIDGASLPHTMPHDVQDQTTQAPGHDRTGSGDSSFAGSAHAEAPSAPTGKDKVPSSNGSTKAASENGKGSSSKSAGPVTYGLETERMCEVKITGSMESVHLALRGCLVMQDQLSALHAEVCDIDYKIQAIVAGRQRQVIQSIQEETATNIYLSTPLVGVLDAPLPGSQQGIGYRHLAAPIAPQPQHAPMPLAMQHTGQSMYSMSGPGANMGMTPHITGGSMMANSPLSNASSMHQGGGYPLHPPPNGPPSDHRTPPHFHGYNAGFGSDGSHQSPYPYMPHQQSPMGPDQSRNMHHNGHGVTGMMYNPMNDNPAPPHHSHATPIQMNHTGMSSIHSYQPGRMNSPMPPQSHLNSPMPHHNMSMPGHMGPPHGMSMSPHQTPYAGQTHLHVGMGGGPMGARFGNGMSPMGPGPMRNGAMDMASHSNINHFNGPHPGLGVHSGEQGRLGKANQIWITGEFFGVQRARDMLLNVAAQKHNLVISRDAVVLPRKLDWLLTERLEDIRTIMNDNATYIQVPSVGSQASLITVFGDHRVNIERTIRSIMSLACQFYVASFWLLPLSFDVLMPQASVNPAQMQPVLKRIAHATGAEIVFKSNCFEMHGLEAQVRAACLMILDLDIVQNFQHEIRFQIELANEHREFISGKKNGKINKIMKMCGVKIKFETFNDYNFLLDISGNNVGSLQGLSMLLEELPAELSFHLPEAYHKRIIGVGGRNIQRIMKAYGVYVKFSNAEEFAAIGGYAENEDNVVARTPAKNHVNLEIMKQAIIDMVNPKDKDYTRETVSIPRRYHRTLLGEKSIFLRDIEQKTSSSIRFPYKETASDLVTIFGPESQIQIAAAMLLEHVPFEADLHVPPNPELTQLVTSPEFIVFTERVKRDHQIAITPSPMFGQGEEAVFKFRCQRSNIDFLGTARDVLEDWLSQHKVQIYPQNAKKRVDNFAGAFPHFNSKLLASGHNKHATPPVEELLPRPRTAVDSTNVKALFEGPGDANPGFAGPLGLPSTRPPELWQAPTGPSHTHARSETDSVKRDSDPIIQERVRAVTQHVSPHSHSQRGLAGSARTQSLDITSLNFSRSLSGSNPFGPMPPSPSGLVSSPNTATGPFFPSSHGPVHANATSRYSVDSIADGLSNIQVSHQ